MAGIRTTLAGFLVLFMGIMIWCGSAFAAGIKVVPSTAWSTPGSDFSFDVVAEGIPADGLGGIQFRLNVSAPAGTVSGVTDLAQAGAGDIAVVSPLLISSPTSTRSGIGDFFWNGKGPSGILAMDNETLTNGSALYTFAHTNGATPPTGSGTVARFLVRVGAGVNANKIDIGLSDVMLLDSGVVYPLDYNTGASVPIKCVTSVPSLLGLTQAQAQAALVSANLSMGNVYEINNDGTLLLNVVLEQSLVAGSSTFCQTPVNLAINTPPALTVSQVTTPTSVGSQVLGGTMAAGAVISVSINTSATVGTVSYPTTTSWSCPISNMAAGNNIINIVATDTYGNRNNAGAIINYTPNQAPAITSASNAAFGVGTSGSFTVTTTGYPLPVLSHSGALPNGVTFNDSTGVLSGTPSAGTGGTYSISITASNGVSPDAVQTFILAVNQAPAITSANNATFEVGTSGSFTVTATGYPIPTLNLSGTLPNGVSFSGSTGQLNGKPSVGANGTYNVTITAGNGVGTNATQGFTLTVNPDSTPPALTVSTLSNGVSTNNDILNISGTVTDGSGIDSLTINGVPVLINPDTSFSYPLTLHGGDNSISSIATDKAGNKTTDTRTVTLDMALPTLGIAAPADNSTSNKQFVTVTGTIDPAGNVQITVNGGTPANATITGNTFTLDVNLAPGLNTVEIAATDLSGKKNTAKRTVVFDALHPTVNITAPAQDILTTQGSIDITGTLADALEPVVVAVTSGADTYAPGVTAGVFKQTVNFPEVKNYPITVKVTENGGNETTLTRNIIHVLPDSINPVVSPTKTAAQTISGTMENGTTVAVACATAVVGAVNYPTASTWTAELTALTEGSNVINVTFTDISGVVTTAQSTIIYDKTPPADGTLHAVAGNAQVNLDWSQFSDSGTGIDSYKLVFDTLALPANCSAGTTIYTGSNTSYLHTGLTNSATLYYRLCAIDKAANVSTGATASATPSSFVDVSGQIKVTIGSFVYNRVTKLYTGSLTITNTGAAISRTVAVALNGLTSGVTLTNALGQYNGGPYTTISNNGIAVGASLTIPLSFSNPANAKINFTTVTFQE